MEHLPGIDKALGLVPSTIKIKAKRKPFEDNSSPRESRICPCFEENGFETQFHLQLFELNNAAHTEILRIGR